MFSKAIGTLMYQNNADPWLGGWVQSSTMGTNVCWRNSVGQTATGEGMKCRTLWAGTLQTTSWSRVPTRNVVCPFSSTYAAWPAKFLQQVFFFFYHDPSMCNLLSLQGQKSFLMGSCGKSNVGLRFKGRLWFVMSPDLVFSKSRSTRHVVIVGIALHLQNMFKVWEM